MRSEQGTAVQATAVGQLGHRLVGNVSQVFTQLRRTSPVADTPKIVIVRDLDELREHRRDLEDLAAEALESNIFYEPILLEPALRYFGAGRQLELVLVYRSDGGPHPRPRLAGFFPFERVGRYRGLPVTALVSFKHLHCFLCTPLVRR